MEYVTTAESYKVIQVDWSGWLLVINIVNQGMMPFEGVVERFSSST